MTEPTFDSDAERELTFQLRSQVRREVARGIRQHCPGGTPGMTAATVLLGTVLAMAAFNAVFGRGGKGRTR